MKLIEIKKDEHYIVVDDSEIKEGDWFYNKPTNYIGQALRKEGNFWVCNNIEGFHLLSEAKKITHSTLPNKGMENVNFISLSKVEEAIYMNRKQTINLVNICMLIFGIFFMFIPNHEQILFLGIGFFTTSALSLLFNNIEK